MMRWDMDDALAIPEIVAAVLAEIEHTVHLYPCLFVNQLFFNEAARLLWAKCGAGHNYDVYFGQSQWHRDHRRPAVWHLAKLALTQPQRAQYYASLIRHLSFHVDFNDYDGMETLLPPGCAGLQLSRAETRWHSTLQSLNFPILERVEVGSMNKAKDNELNGTSLLCHYVRPTLVSFASGYMPGDPTNSGLLYALRTRCSRLTTLHLKHAYIDMPDDEFCSFLEAFPLLSDVVLGQHISAAQSKEVFSLLARDRKSPVTCLSLPAVQDDWVAMNSPGESFLSGLQWFGTSLSVKALESLTPYIRSTLTKVSLSNMLPSRHILAAVAALPHLTTLYANFHPDSVLNGVDLIMLSRGCPKLHDLRLYSPQLELTDAVITDDTIAEMWSNLPKLCFVHIDLPTAELTENSLFSLGKSCRSLEFVAMTGHVNFSILSELAGAIKTTNNSTNNNSETRLFPHLKTLGIQFKEGVAPRIRGVKSMAKSLLEQMPVLEAVYLSEHRDGLESWPGEEGDGDWLVDREFTRALEKRNRKRGIPKVKSYQRLPTNYRSW